MKNCNCKKYVAALKSVAGKGSFLRPCQFFAPCGCQKISVFAASGLKVGAVAPHGKFVVSTLNGKGGFKYHKVATVAQVKILVNKALRRG